MGTRGPQPLPANVHKLRGNPSKLSAGELSDGLQPETEIPTCPKHLWPGATREWKRITPELKKYGLISKLDRAALALYCQDWARLEWAEQQLTLAMEKAERDRLAFEADPANAGAPWTGGDGFMLTTPNGGFAYSPYWVAANKASERVDKWLAAFGMSPSSRGRVSPSNDRQGQLFPPAAGGQGWNSL